MFLSSLDRHSCKFELAHTFPQSISIPVSDKLSLVVQHTADTVWHVSMLHLTNTCILCISWLQPLFVLCFSPIISHQAK